MKMKITAVPYLGDGVQHGRGQTALGGFYVLLCGSACKLQNFV